MRVLRSALVAIAASGALLLVLIALGHARLGPWRLVRFRETTLAIEAALLLTAVAGPRPGDRLRGWGSAVAATLASPRFFAAAMAVMLALFLDAAITQHLAWRTGSHDFSMIDEALHQTLRGRLLFSPVLGRSFLSEHFSPILLLLVPLHAIVPSPWLLVIVQPLALWAAAWSLRTAWREDGIEPAIANLGALLYLNHAITVSTLDYLFHMECFLPLALFELWRARRGPTWRYAAWLLLALAIKEDVGVYVAGLGAWLFVAERRRGLGVATALAGLLWSAAARKWWIPAVARAGAGYAFASRWSQWGTGPMGAAAGLVSHPGALLAALFSKACLAAFASVLLLPFLSRWGWLLVLAPWVVNATSALPAQSRLLLYYGMPLLAFSAIAAASALRPGSGFRRRARRVAPALAVLAVALDVSHLTFPAIPPHGREIEAALGLLPAHEPIQLMWCFFPRAGYEREKILLRPGDPLTHRWVVMRSDAATWPFAAAEAESTACAAIASGAYRNRSTIPGFFLLERAAARDSVEVQVRPLGGLPKSSRGAEQMRPPNAR